MSSTFTLNTNLKQPKQSKLLSVRSNLQICFLAGHTLFNKISTANHWSWSLNCSAFLCCSVMYCYQTYLKRTCTQKFWTKTKNVVCKNHQKVTAQRKSVKIFLAGDERISPWENNFWNRSKLLSCPTFSTDTKHSHVCSRALRFVGASRPDGKFPRGAKRHPVGRTSFRCDARTPGSVRPAFWMNT